MNKPTSHLYLAYSYERELKERESAQPKGRANMPKAVVSAKITERKDLETLPPDPETGEEGGFVELRHMSYGEYLKRRDMISNMSFKGEGKNTEAFMKMANEEVARYEFNTCIVDHNLQDENGNNLDFRTARAFQMLNPRVGEEISNYIDEMNKWEKDNDDPLENSGDE